MGGQADVSFVRRLARRVCTWLIDAIWTSGCPICRAPLEDGEVVCRSCYGGFVPLEGIRCVRCSAPLPFEDAPCPTCESLPPNISGRIIVTEYERIREILVAFKYGHIQPIGNILAERFGPVLRQHPLARRAEVVVPVPLHGKRLRERGFNQSDILAIEAAKALGISCCFDAVRRVRTTKRQATLKSPIERAENVKGAFAPHRTEAIRGRRVLLVDDVITTGSTVGACAEALLQGGAKDVIAAALAHPFLSWNGDMISIDGYGV